MIDGYGAAAALGSLTFAIFLAAMTVGRWFGPGAARPLRPRPADPRDPAWSRSPGWCSSCTAASLPVAMAGAALWGLGVALGFPVGMSAAADDARHAAGA